MPDVRLKLIDAAAALFAMQGYEAVSMRDIARVVGVTQASLYYHFRDKAELIQSALTHVFELRGRDLHAELAEHPDDQLEAFARWFAGTLLTDTIFSRLLYRELLDGTKERISQLSQTVLQLPFHSITQAVVASGRSDEEAKAIALSCVGFILGQILVLPLAPDLTGQDNASGAPDIVAKQLLTLIRAEQREA
jgi:AcrR family transcriptional regulator